MEEIEILLITTGLAILAGVSWWALNDVPKIREYKYSYVEPKKKRKPYLCKCGETNPDEFYGTSKSKCKECTKKDRREKYKQRKECSVK